MATRGLRCIRPQPRIRRLKPPTAANRTSSRKNPSSLPGPAHPRPAHRTIRPRALTALVATVAAAGCAKPVTTLGYGLPSPPDAVYEIADSLEVEIDAPGGKWEIAGGYSLTLDMFFEADAAGMRVRGIAESFEGSLSDPVGDLGDLNGTLEFVANGGGVAEVTSFPGLFGLAAREVNLRGLPHNLFPRLPDDIWSLGDTWTDTVRWHTDQTDAEHNFVAAYTYTLVGDTVVGRRELLHIGVAGELDFFTVSGGWGNHTIRRVKGPLTGFILWDPERRLVAYHQHQSNLVGTVTTEEEQSFPIRTGGRTRIRLRR